ncbi:Warthog protein 1 [Aphelenchoides bicaudatus]|nr:Warthog protein 1 [Aphelenchoides bicaudatus]
MRRLVQRLLFLGLCVNSSWASYCGKTAVPYSFEVLPNGAPVLGCAQPSCVAAAEEPLIDDSEFLVDVTGKHDSAPKLIANCSGQFNELSCPRKNQFVGGIEYIDHPRQPLILQCCTYDGLRFSQEVGTTTVGPGEAITGGEVVRGGRQISFDVIANVRKIVRSSGSQRVSYEVTVRRMNCLPDPPEPEVSFDQAVPAEVLKVLSSASAKEVGVAEKQEKTDRKENKKQRKQFENSAQSFSHRNSEASLGPNTPPPAQQVNQQPVYQPQEQQIPQQPAQQFVDPNQQQFVPTAVVETSTAFPTILTFFPTHSFPTLPPHTFATFPPHTFATLPPHTFPPHTFTFPPLTATQAPATIGFGQPASFPAAPASQASGVAFAAPSVSVGSQGAPLPTLAPFSAPTFAPFSPLPAIGQPQDNSAAQFGQQQIAQPQQIAQQPGQPQQQFAQPAQQPVQQLGQAQQTAQQVYSSQNMPQNPTQAMGTILQNFQGNFRPIELPGLGVVGYGSVKK